MLCSDLMLNLVGVWSPPFIISAGTTPTQNISAIFATALYLIEILPYSGSEIAMTDGMQLPQ